MSHNYDRNVLFFPNEILHFFFNLYNLWKFYFFYFPLCNFSRRSQIILNILLSNYGISHFIKKRTFTNFDKPSIFFLFSRFLCSSSFFGSSKKIILEKRYVAFAISREPARTIFLLKLKVLVALKPLNFFPKRQKFLKKEALFMLFLFTNKKIWILLIFFSFNMRPRLCCHGKEC